MSVQIVIDPNVRVEGNKTFAGFEDVHGGFAHLDDVVDVAVDETDLVGSARVAWIDWEARLIYLDVDWASIKPSGQQAFLTTSKDILGPNRIGPSVNIVFDDDLVDGEAYPDWPEDIGRSEGL